MGKRDLETLVVSLEAQLKTFEKNMSRAYPMADKAMSQVERRFQKAEGVMARFGKNFSSSFSPASIAASLTAGSFVAAVKTTIDALSDISDNAQRAGISIKEFQRLTFAAQQSGGGAETIVGLFKEFNKQLAEAKDKGNDLSAILEANGISIRDSNGNMRDSVELFAKVADLIKNARDQIDAARIANAGFKKSAADALPLLKSGGDAIREMGDEAEKTGHVFDTELVQRIESIGDKADKVWGRWKHAAMDVIAEVAVAIDDRISNGAGIVKGVTRDTFMKPEFVGPEINRLAKQRKALQDQLGAGKDFLPNISAPILEAQIAELSRRIAELSAVFLPALRGNPFDSYYNTKKPTVMPSGTVRGSQNMTGRGGGRLGILDLIGQVEGTDRGRGYSEVLGYGAFGGGSADLVTMKIGDVLRLGDAIRRHPANPYNSSAVGRYQLTGETIRDFLPKLGLTKDDLFTPENQDAIANAVINSTGGNLDRLRGRWPTLGRVSDVGVRDALVQGQGGRVSAAETVNRTEQKAAEDTAEALKKRNTQTREWLDEFKEINEDAAKESARAWDNFGQSVGGVAEGFVQALLRGEKASEAFKAAIAQLASQAVSQLFNLGFQGGAGGGGLFGGIVRSIAPGLGSGIGAAGNAGAVPLTAPSAIMSTALAGNAAPLTLRVAPSPYFDVTVDSRANALDAVRQAGTLNYSRRNAPKTMNRFQQLGTT
jgi:muramidase (phage lysozyme)